MDRAVLLPSYLLTCKRFGVAIRVKENCAYVYDTDADAIQGDEPGRRCGYFTASGILGGVNKNTVNACGLLMDICKRNGLMADFRFPGYLRLIRPMGDGAVEVAKA